METVRKVADRHDILVKKHEQLNKVARKGQIVFTGSSLMEDFPISELALTLPGQPVIYNRGIGGDTIDGLDKRLESAVFELEPKKLFINIGTNDISALVYDREDMLVRYRTLLEKIICRLPETEITVLSYYPVNRDCGYDTTWFRARTNEEIDAVNLRLEEMTQELGLRFVNVTDCLRDENGNLREEWTLDGMHMYPDAYMTVLRVLAVNL